MYEFATVNAELGRRLAIAMMLSCEQMKIKDQRISAAMIISFCLV